MSAAMRIRGRADFEYKIMYFASVVQKMRTEQATLESRINILFVNKAKTNDSVT